MAFLIKKAFILLLKLLYLNLKASLIKKKDQVILVAEFGLEGGALTYFKYVLEYFESKKISYLLVLSEGQKQFVRTNLKTIYCKEIIIGPAVWCPFFSKKNKLAYNLGLLINQLHELLFFSKLNVRLRPKYFYFSVSNPEHYLFEFCMNAKMIYVCHTSPANNMDTLKKYIVNSALSKCKKIVAVSNCEKEEMIISWGIKNSKTKYIQVVYNYYQPNDKVDITNEVKKSNPINVLTIGALEYYKNPKLWLNIAKKLTIILGTENIVFYWLGSGSLFEKFVKDAENYPNIHFEGYKENVDIYYQKSHIYVQPSIYESFGISVVGAMYYKLPCIVSDAGGLKEVVRDKISGFVVANQNESNYIDFVKILFDKEGLRTRLGNEGFENYEKLFKRKNWESSMNSVLKFIV